MAAGGKRGKSTTTTTSTKPKPNETKPKQNRRSPLNQGQLIPEDIITLLGSAVSTANSFLLQNDLHLRPSQTLSLESLLCSTYSFLLSHAQLQSHQSIPSPLQPSSSFTWFDRLLSISSIDEPRWVHFFHLSRPTYSRLLQIISPSLFSSLPTIPPNTALAATLFRLSHGVSYHSLASRFGFPSSAVACRVFYSVCKALNHKFSALLDFQSDLPRILHGFGWISLPNCCGVLGFGRFSVDLDVLGPNGSVLVQALVDSDGKFLDVSAGWPCTVRPESILRQSKLYSRVQESRELLNGHFVELGGGISIPQYILGDACFPLYPWLLTPYSRYNEEDSFGSAEREFNRAHVRAMGLVDVAFRRVKARWQLLSKRWKGECLEFLPIVIVTGCLLHNFLIECGEPMFDDNAGCSDENELPRFEGEVDESGGGRTRDVLAHYLSRVSYGR